MRDLTPVQLTALVYFNRGVAHLSEREFAHAAAANLAALALDPANALAADNLLATINHWSLALAAAGRHVDALSVLKPARTVAPDNKHLLDNQRYIEHQMVTRSN